MICRFTYLGSFAKIGEGIPASGVMLASPNMRTDPWTTT
jgi:hypothetical protein